VLTTHSASAIFLSRANLDAQGGLTVLSVSEPLSADKPARRPSIETEGHLHVDRQGGSPAIVDHDLMFLDPCPFAITHAVAGLSDPAADGVREAVGRLGANFRRFPQEAWLSPPLSFCSWRGDLVTGRIAPQRQAWRKGARAGTPGWRGIPGPWAGSAIRLRISVD
jgi:hypothetical protein